jgi:hypothetical protein
LPSAGGLDFSVLEAVATENEDIRREPAGRVDLLVPLCLLRQEALPSSLGWNRECPAEFACRTVDVQVPRVGVTYRLEVELPYLQDKPGLMEYAVYGRFG